MSNMGYIIEVRKKYAIIMSEESGFIRIKTKPGMISGILIEYSNDQILKSKMKLNVWLASSGVAAAVILMVFIFSTIQTFISSKTYLYVDIDINPSIELSVDKKGVIMKADSLNSDGKNLIDKLMLKGMNLKDGLIIVFRKSIEDGFVNTDKDNVVLISTCVNPNLDDDLGDKNLDSILSPITQMDLKDYNIKTTIIKVKPEDRKLAMENDLSMGRYELYKNAQEYKIDLSLVQVKNSSVSDLLSKIHKPGRKTLVSVITNTPNSKIVTVTPFETKMQEKAYTPVITNTPGSTPTPVKAKVTAKAQIRIDTKMHTNTAIPVNTITQAVKTTVAPQYLSTPTPTKGKSVELNGTGLRGEYYNNMDLTDLKTVQIDAKMDFNWSKYPPPGIKNLDAFSVRWKGEIQSLYSEKYTFYVTRDNGVRLWIDNKLIIDQWNNKYFVTDSASIDLEAGKRYDIKMEYFNNTGLAYVKLEWSSFRTERMVIPQNCLYP